MSTTEDLDQGDDEVELGIQAFQHVALAVDRFGTTLATTEQRHAAIAASQNQAASKVLQAADMALTASQNALQAAKTEIRSSLLWTGLTGLGVVLAGCTGAFYLGQSSGWDQGQATGYASSRNEAAAAAWANTPNGQRALALDRLGSLNKLATCSEAGWAVQKVKDGRACFVAKAPDGQSFGWLIP